jgi:membrane-associated HD superfamily phosphohydrolase
MNRFNWDLRREEIPSIEGVFVFGSPVGAMVGPGTYRAQLSYKGQVQEQMIEVLADPRIDATEADYRYQQELLNQLDKAVRDIHESIIRVQAARGQLEALAKHIPAEEQYAALTERAKALAKSLSEWEAELIQPKQKTFQDVINFENQLSSELLNLMGKVDAPDPRQPTALVENIEMRIGEWGYLQADLDQLIQQDLKAFNAAYLDAELPAIIMMD